MLTCCMSRRSHPRHPLAIKQLGAGFLFCESGLGLSLAKSLQGKINSMQGPGGGTLDRFNHTVAAKGRAGQSADSRGPQSLLGLY